MENYFLFIILNVDVAQKVNWFKSENKSQE